MESLVMLCVETIVEENIKYEKGDINEFCDDLIDSYKKYKESSKTEFRMILSDKVQRNQIWYDVMLYYCKIGDLYNVKHIEKYCNIDYRKDIKPYNIASLYENEHITNYLFDKYVDNAPETEPHRSDYITILSLMKQKN